MIRRAAICIGVDRVVAMTPLKAAAQSARDFQDWAKSQGCDTTLHIDDSTGKVSVEDVFHSVEQFVSPGIYGQLIVFFSGHGILTAPGAEYWLLSGAPVNPNEAVNVSATVVDARNAGIPHVVLVSDACRSSVTGPPLSGVRGGTIFPNRDFVPAVAEIDVYYATRPGDPAYEVPEAEATRKFEGVFTSGLLKFVKAPPTGAVETIPEGLKVISSHRLKSHLEAMIPVMASDIDVRIRQTPNVIVETALPKYFAQVKPRRIIRLRGRSRRQPPPSLDRAIAAAAPSQLPNRAAIPSPEDIALAETSGLKQEIEEVGRVLGQARFKTVTGFTVIGAAHVQLASPQWDADVFRGDAESLWHIRLTTRANLRNPSTALLEFDRRVGAGLPILPGFIGTVILGSGRISSVNYVPSEGTVRHRAYEAREQELNELKAFAAVAARNGRFVLEDQGAEQFAARIRQAKGIDPTMGLYAAYAYAQVGAYADVLSVYSYMINDPINLPIPFDVGLLATRQSQDAHLVELTRLAPPWPMLAQGWAFLDASHPMHTRTHDELRPHLIPALWTSLSPTGVEIARGILGGASYEASDDPRA